MRHLLVLVILIVPLIAQAQPAISVEGIPTAKVEQYKQKITSLLNHRSLTLEDLEQVLDALYHSDMIAGGTVYLDDTNEAKPVYIFALKQKQVIKTIQLKGASAFAKSDILSELGINEGEGLSEDKIRQGLDNIKKFYNLNGYLNASVSADFASQDASDLTLIVTINEGLVCVFDRFTFLSVNEGLNKNLSNLLHKKIGKPYSQTNVNEIQQQIMQYLTNEKYYSTIVTIQDPQINDSQTKVSLAFSLTEPYYYSLIFNGNAQYTDQQIMKELNLDQTNRLTSSPVDDLKERIISFYKKRGYADITVKSNERLLAQEYTRRISFDIDEGPRVKIKDILVEGNISRPSHYYADFIFAHSGDLIEKHYYNSEDLDTGIKNLVIDLQNQGFISAAIPSTRIDFDKKRETVVVKVTLNEGPQTFIENLAFKGAEKVSPSQLETVTGLKAGKPLNLSELADASNRINEYYRSLGYLDARVMNQPKTIISYFDDNRKAHLNFEIYEGPQVVVNGLIVEGNTFTKEYVVTRELQFHNGEILTPEKISYSETRLQRLGLFDSVDIRPLSDDPHEGRRAVLVVITERNPGLFKAGVGANNEIAFTLKAFVGAAYRNLFGTGRGVNLRVEGNYKFANDKLFRDFSEHEVSFGYTEPYVFDTENTLKAAITQSAKLYYINNLITPNEVFAIASWQSDLILERDLTRELKVQMEVYGFNHSNTYEIHTTPLVPDVTLDIASIGPTLIYDLRDNIYNPTRGSLSSISLEYSAPFMGSSGSVNYLKSVASFTKYYPLGPIVFAQQISGGYLRNLSLSGGAIIPNIKAFTLGGRSTIRGFAATEVFPALDPTVNGFSADYELFGLAKTEFRFPISGSFGGAIFYDGGHVEYPGFGQTYAWRHSVGVGLRYQTPVGPVSLEYGYKLNRDPSRVDPNTHLPFIEGPDAVHFSIGVF